MNIYAPNDVAQQVSFFKRLNQQLEKFAQDTIVIGTDFNCALTSNDKRAGKPVSKKSAVIQEINTLCDLYNLSDIWRNLNSDKQCYTWKTILTALLISSSETTPLFHHIPPFPPVLIASVMLCAISSLNLVSPLGAWSFRPVLHKDSRLLRPTRLPWWRLTKPLHALILVACLLPHQSRTLPIT